MSEKVHTDDIETQPPQAFILPQTGNTDSISAAPYYDFSQNGITMPFPPLPPLPPIPPFPNLPQYANPGDTSQSGPTDSPPGTLYVNIAPNVWILAIPPWFKLEDLGSGTHLVEVDATSLELLFQNLPTSDPGGGLVWLSAT